MNKKSALVTGATGDLGKAVVNLLLEKHYHVIAHGNTNLQILQELKQTHKNSDALDIYRADAINTKELLQLMNYVNKQNHQLNALVNTIGGATPISFSELSIEEWKKSLAINLTAPFICIQKAIPLLKKAKGAVVNISSVAAMTGGAFGPHYATTKAGIIGLTRSAAKELGPLGIRINTIAPGPVDSKMTNKLPDEVMKRIIMETSLRKTTSLNEFSQTVFYLIDDATAITGQTIVLDGGRFFH